MTKKFYDDALLCTMIMAMYRDVIIRPFEIRMKTEKYRERGGKLAHNVTGILNGQLKSHSSGKTWVGIAER